MRWLLQEGAPQLARGAMPRPHMQKLPLDKIKERPQIGMVAGGSGLTPMLQVGTCCR